MEYYLGTIINFFLIIAGSLLGIILCNWFPKNVNQTVMYGLALATAMLGIQMGIKSENMILVILSIVIGAVSGELIGIQRFFDRIGALLQKKFSKKNDKSNNFTKGFVSTSLLFCVGPMAIMGSVENGLTGNYTLLLTKSIMDGFASIAFASSLGIGVLFSSFTVLLYQGTLTMLAELVKNILTDDVVREMTATGGILMIGLALNILGIRKVKVGNLLPALFIVVILKIFFFK